MSALNKAAKAVLREALDAVDVHPCDVHDDAVRAKGLFGPMADLYAAAIALPVAAGSMDTCSEMRALCSACGGTGDVHSIDGEWRGQCTCVHAWEMRAEKAEARVKELEVRMLSSASGRQTMPT
ncbi:hypothetical protein BA896_001515 [Janthinobacterium lividum]|uniref:Uncharacterized protein n=1 Tax=Janthinobacterium lividum TaxID=29581 RepID=A0A1E8PNS8_9BURK|nr:hypothetical protein BA896_001515 [Janthinobacterium lividum]